MAKKDVSGQRRAQKCRGSKGSMPTSPFATASVVCVGEEEKRREVKDVGVVRFASKETRRIVQYSGWRNKWWNSKQYNGSPTLHRPIFVLIFGWNRLVAQYHVRHREVKRPVLVTKWPILVVIHTPEEQICHAYRISQIEIPNLWLKGQEHVHLPSLIRYPLSNYI